MMGLGKSCEEAYGLSNLDCFGCLRFLKKLLNLKSNDYDFDADEWSPSCENEESRVPFARELRYEKKATLSSSFQNFRIHVGTWNVAGRLPPSSLDLSDWFCLDEPADIYVLGFQEIVPLNAANVFGVEDETPVDVWETLIRQTLNRGSKKACTDVEDTDASDVSVRGDEMLPLIAPLVTPESTEAELPSRYVRIASKQMVGLFITVWIRREIRQVVSNVKVSCVGCGIMGYLGNKGSIAVSLLIHQTSFCFICAHLTSGDREGDDLRRNTDVREILRRTSFSRSFKASHSLPQTILDHERIIWLGDLNYRLSLSGDEAMVLVENEDWQTLLAKDQLKAQQAMGRVLEDWKEGTINFAPTYKYIVDSDTYATRGAAFDGQARVPAWCDRILWLGKGLNQIAYTRSEYRISDHRPVTAVFTTQVQVFYCED